MLWALFWTGFVHPESALETEEGVFVSDIGTFGAQDGKIWLVKGGARSVYATGLKDPKGLCVSKGRLFVADVDRVWEITGGALKLVAGPNAFPQKPRFLNGMAADATGYLYLSDTFRGDVYRLTKRGKVERLFQVDKPNGLAVASNGTLYVITFTDPGRIYAWERGELHLVYQSSDIAGGDGLALDEERGFLYASGYNSGKIVRINLNTAQAEVIAQGLKTPADIHLSLDKRKLLVPLLEAGEVKEIDLGY